jgi:hypothetical protein
MLGMKLTLDRSSIEKLHHHAASAAQLVGHLDDDAQAELIDQLGDHVDAVVHGLTEILGDPRALAEDDAAAPHGRVSYDSTPMLASSAGGAR